MEEEGIRFSVSKDVFYNPQMRLCRSISSLAVGAIGEKLEVVDAFCASGIRGFRYAKENRNVSKLTSLDIEKKAITLARKNAKAGKIPSSRFAAVCANISRAAFELDADFLEIDPFGTPAPYLVDAFRFFNTKKSAYLSVTATDVAVLCGGRTAACMKNYHSKPLNNEFTHETGLRIMLKKLAETAAEFNMGMTPLISFSDKHYLKSVLKVERSADKAYSAMKSIGHVSYCWKCGWRGSGKFPERCGNRMNKEGETKTGHPRSPRAIGGEEKATEADAGPDAGDRVQETDYAGPLWAGELHDSGFLRAMAKLNSERDYSDRQQISRMLSLMEGEAGMPPYYYDVHSMCRTLEMHSVPSMEAVLDKLHKDGHRAVRTHFSPLGVKTDAPYESVAEAVRWKG
jgi:tRNA (guanine26-N2/guanine27-N2)-dimethyltransferase